MNSEVWLCYHIAPAIIRTNHNRLIATTMLHPQKLIE